MPQGKVILVGAGPGDAGLLTVKGRACLEQAGVVIYDRLVNPALLRHAPASAELIYAGKEPGRHSLDQTAINELLVTRAREGKVVVRLKGGDPFVFGRGGEEAEALAAAAVPFEVVPGVSAAVAVPAYAGIPVTHRRCNSSLTIVTGNEEPGKERGGVDWDRLASPAAGTVVFLMGCHNLPAICRQLIKYGRDPATPVAVIERGATAEQRTVTGSLADIERLAEEAGIGNPVVVVVGEVVTLRERIAWRERAPLFGRRVVVTRASSQAGTLAAAVEALGAEAWEFPVIEIVPPEDLRPLEEAVQEAATYDWLVFTSANGVEAFFERFFSSVGDCRQLAGVKIGAIGEATAQSLRKWGLQADIIPREYRAEGLLAVLGPEKVGGRRVLLPRAEVVRPVLANGLRRHGAEVHEVAAYTTVLPRGGSEDLCRLLAANKVDVITFTSSSTVRNLCAMLGEEARSLLGRVALASIGPVTSRTARELGLKVSIEAEKATVAGLVAAVEAYFRGQRADA